MNSTIVRAVPALLLGMGVLLTSGARAQFRVPPVRPLSSITTVFDGATGVDRVIGEQERQVAGMSEYAYRDFASDSSGGFSTYVGYYERQEKGKTIHSPKNCLPGAGWETLQSERVAVASVYGSALVNRVLLANKGSRALVYYWYQGRGRIESSEYRVKWDLLRDAAMWGRTEEALVRIVVPVASVRGGNATMNDAAVLAADSTARRVAPLLADEVAKVLPAAPGSSSP